MAEKKTAAPKHKHRATYSRDKRTGGYNVSVEGPHAGQFAGRTVPVETKGGETSMEDLDRLLWAGDSKLNPGTPAALYSFKAKPKADDGEAIEW